MKTNRTKGGRRFSLQWMTGTAMMIAVTLVLGSTPLGLIRTPILTATTLHIPVIIATLVLGVEAGILTGLVFGVQSLINNLTSASFFGPFFINPMVSVLPRILFPVCVHMVSMCVSRLLGKRDRGCIIAYIASSALGTAAHTVMVMGMIYLLNAQKIELMLTSHAGVPQALAQRGVGMGMVALSITNGVPEMIVAAVIAPSIALALRKAFGRIHYRS